LYAPTLVGVNGPESYAPSPVTGTVDEKIPDPVHVGLPGPNRKNVIVPVGLNPPPSDAWSLMVPPMLASVAVVVSVGVAARTSETSPVSLHGVELGKLAASPLYDAVQRHKPGVAGVNDPESYVPLPETGSVAVKAGEEQVSSGGE
jgi:hypothetical protein